MPPTSAPPRRGFPISAVATFTAAGLLVGWTVAFFLIWIQTVGSQRGWWAVPQDDEPGASLVLAGVGAVPAAFLIWLGARRCRRAFGYSRLATGLIATASVVGTVVLLAAYRL